MSLSIVISCLLLSSALGDTDSNYDARDKKTCEDIMKEVKILLGEMKLQFLDTFGQIQRSQSSMQGQMNNIAKVVGSLEQKMASVQIDLSEVKLVTRGKSCVSRFKKPDHINKNKGFVLKLTL